MKIAVLSCSPDRSGGGAPGARDALATLSAGLRGRGHQVEELDADRAVRTDADLLHAHGWAAGLRASAQPGLAGCPLVQTFSRPGGGARSAVDSADVRRLLRLPVTRVVTSRPGQVRVLQMLGAPVDRISVVPPYVDLQIFRPEGLRAARGAGHRLTLVGGLGSADGAEDVVRLLPLLAHSELVVLGRAGENRDDDQRRLALLAERCGVARRVMFLPAASPKAAAAVLRSTSVCVLLPRHAAGDVRMVRWAMACGVPVVGTAVGNLAEVIEDRVTGLLVRPGRVEEVADTVRRLLDNEAWRGWLGTAAADHAAARHGPGALARDIEAVYQVALDGRTPHAQATCTAPTCAAATRAS